MSLMEAHLKTYKAQRHKTAYCLHLDAERFIVVGDVGEEGEWGNWLSDV